MKKQEMEDLERDKHSLIIIQSCVASQNNVVPLAHKQQ